MLTVHGRKPTISYRIRAVSGPYAYYHYYKCDDRFRAMMSGDTPECHSTRDPFHELKDKSPACSSGLPKPASGELVTASVLVEPQPTQDGGPVKCPPVDGLEPRRLRSTSTDDDVIETAETPLAIRKCPNGIAQDDTPDTTDSAVFVGNNINGKKKQSVNEAEEDDGCVVKCLYYTLQCCECTIM